MSDQEPLPLGVKLTALDEAFRRDPYPILERLRQQDPTLNDTELVRRVFTRHDDVKAILRDKELLSDPRSAAEGSFTREYLGANLGPDEEPSMLLMDEPGHRRLRSLVSKPFTPGAVEKWRPRTRDVVQRVLDAISTDEFDLIAEFAGPIPTIVIAEMLGIDASLHADFKRWSDLMVQVGFNPFPTDEQTEAADTAREQLHACFEDQIRFRSQNLGDDLLSDMLRAEEEGETLTHQEIVSQCDLLLVAGNVTTTDLIGNGVLALIQHPEQMAKLRANPGLIENAVEEMLRFDSPVTNSGRIAHDDTELAGCPVHKGESLSVSLASANRDPDVYPEPNRFDIEREDTHHQAFGGGRHLCLGAHLARLEAQEAILALLQRYPVLRLSERGYTHHAIPSFRGMSECWVTTR
jgi:cytochrome P450